MERSFEEVSFRRLCDGAVSVQIAEPFRILGVHQMFESPVIDLFVYIEILFISGKFVSIQRSDNCLALRPPEFHILSIILTRQPLAVTEIDNSAILFIPTPLELPVKKNAYNLLHLLKKLIASSSSLISCSSSSVTTLNGVRFGPRSRPMSFIILFPPTIFPPCRHITLMTS